MTTRPDPTSLFEGLDGRALEQREELISWLLDQGFDLGQIAGAVSPMFLPANRVLGHDGTLVSADDVAQASGVPVELEGDPVWWSSRYATWGWWVVVLFRANSDELSWLWVRVRTPGRVAIPKPKAARKAAAAETVASTTSKTGHARVHAGKHLTSRDNQRLLTSEP